MVSIDVYPITQCVRTYHTHVHCIYACFGTYMPCMCRRNSFRNCLCLPQCSQTPQVPTAEGSPCEYADSDTAHSEPVNSVCKQYPTLGCVLYTGWKWWPNWVVLPKECNPCPLLQLWSTANWVCCNCQEQLLLVSIYVHMHTYVHMHGTPHYQCCWQHTCIHAYVHRCKLTWLMATWPSVCCSAHGQR